MKIQSKETSHAIAGAGIGLIACLMVRVGIGFIWEEPADLTTLTLYGLAGLLAGTYLGYFLPSFDFADLNPPMKDKKSLT